MISHNSWIMLVGLLFSLVSAKGHLENAFHLPAIFKSVGASMFIGSFQVRLRGLIWMK